jgi:hypothetical protein
MNSFKIHEYNLNKLFYDIIIQVMDGILCLVSLNLKAMRVYFTNKILINTFKFFL